MKTEKVVMGLSGGMDSTTLLGLLLREGLEVHACSFTYGSKHGEWEMLAVDRILHYYNDLRSFYEPYVRRHSYDLTQIMFDFKSNLLISGESIPEGHYESESMKLTVVPGRNMIFASIMAGLAESIGAKFIALGVHQGDHHIYPDCRTEFIKALDSAIYLSTDRKVEVITPLLKDDKASILEKGFNLNPPTPYHITRTCYKNQSISCGKCGSCVERLEAFQKIGKKDPILYKS